MLSKTSTGGKRVDNGHSRPVITVFHCVNAFNHFEPSAPEDNIEIRGVELPCSSMVRDVFLLKAFEAGSDAVVVLTCPEGECLHIDGSIRAGKRIHRLQGLLDDIGVGGWRLSHFNLSQKDRGTVDKIIEKTVSDLKGTEPVVEN